MIPQAPAEQVASERTPIYDAVWRRTTLDRALVGLRSLVYKPCGTCGATGEDPCLTSKGNVTKRHKGRRA